ncbi:hypothetical protein ARMSODRAFT_948196 [Armillaria solidipes]|uniref:Uncharacterized protein n=1 Tax=Armillaria solidipes TaxID=1076256 RepID=A0A2H3CAY5_9AGAR|nr:hypothetical protein ARMSODRAFT_948196 [Armillaria solidipes]
MACTEGWMCGRSQCGADGRLAGRSSCAGGRLVAVGAEHRRALCSQVWRTRVDRPGTVRFIETTVFVEDTSGAGFDRCRCCERSTYVSPLCTMQTTSTANECPYPASDAGSGRSHPISEVGTQHSHSAGDAETEYSHSISEASESHAPEASPSAVSFIRSLLAKLLPCLPCLWADFHDDNDVASIFTSDPIWSHPIFPAHPLQILRLSYWMISIQQKQSR